MAKFYSTLTEAEREDLLRLAEVPFARKGTGETLGAVEVLLARQRYEEAERRLVELTRAGDDSLRFAAYMFLGQLFEDVDRPGAAVEAYREASRLLPQAGEPCFSIAEILAADEPQLAEEALRPALGLLREGGRDAGFVATAVDIYVRLLRTLDRRAEADAFIAEMLHLYPTHELLLQLAER